MRTLKALVIGMGVVIAIGFAVVIVAIVYRVGGEAPTTLSFGAKPGAGGADFGTLALPVPAGATVTGTASGDGRLILTLALAGGGTRIVVIELATGRRLGAIDLVQGGGGTAGATMPGAAAPVPANGVTVPLAPPLAPAETPAMPASPAPRAAP